MIQTYKIMNNIDRIDGKKLFKPCKEVRTRGHSKRVEKTQCKSLVRRNAFSQRMANDWNALPDAVVMSGSINQFKARLGTGLDIGLWQPLARGASESENPLAPPKNPLAPPRTCNDPNVFAAGIYDFTREVAHFCTLGLYITKNKYELTLPSEFCRFPVKIMAAYAH